MSRKSKRPMNGVVSYAQPARYIGIGGKDRDHVCPRHGDRFVIKRGTNRCPKGRKLGVDCAQEIRSRP